MASISAPALSAQTGQTDTARATLRGWEEEVRLALFDRAGGAFGRTSDRGILQRFHEAMDSEYELDAISSAFLISEDAEWYGREAGARYWAGSIDHLQVIQVGELKSRVGLGEAWGAEVRFRLHESLTAERRLLQLGFRRELAGGRGSAFAQGTLRAVKPEIDIEVGFRWTIARGEVTVAVAALDVFSDVVYQGLGVAPGVADTALDYTAHPFTGRVALEVPLGEDWRIEAYALQLTPTSVTVQSQSEMLAGFSQDERYSYAGGLLEFGPSHSTALGAFGTWVRARIDRSPLPAGRPADDFELTEITSRVGLYAIHRLPGRLSVEGWLARVWRSEDRVRPVEAMAPRLEYEDRTWAGRWSLVYRAPGGFRAMPGLEFTSRGASGIQPVTTREPLAQDDVRLRGDLGWRIRERAVFVVGANVDLDEGSFDGAHGRFTLSW